MSSTALSPSRDPRESGQRPTLVFCALLPTSTACSKSPQLWPGPQRPPKPASFLPPAWPHYNPLSREQLEMILMSSGHPQSSLNTRAISCSIGLAQKFGFFL